MSTVFTFDRELFFSKVYERALRGSLKESLRRQQTDIPQVMQSGLKKQTERSRSRAVELTLDGDLKRRRREYKVLVLGNPNSGVDILKQMMIAQSNSYSAEELLIYRDKVRNSVLKLMRTVIEHLIDKWIGLDDEEMDHVEAIWQQIGDNETYMTEITTTVANAMKSLWDSPNFLEFFDEAVSTNSICVPDSAE
jgi:guanine nucleotide-binding protein G(i) subunit alpha